MAIRDVYPTKHYSKEGFVEHKFEINEEDLQEIIEDYLMRNSELDFGCFCLSPRKGKLV
jgi:hypothetical protein